MTKYGNRLVKKPSEKSVRAKRLRERRARMLELDGLERKTLVFPKLDGRAWGNGPPHIPTYAQEYDTAAGKWLPGAPRSITQCQCDCGGKEFEAFRFEEQYEGNIRCCVCGRWHVLHDG